jgi:hypothetical protein
MDDEAYGETFRIFGKKLQIKKTWKKLLKYIPTGQQKEILAMVDMEFICVLAQK